jgi:hypothetical protein
MTPAKRRPATPVSEGPTRTTPDVPVVAKRSPVRAANPKDDTQLLGPEGEPITQEVATARPAQAGEGDSEPRMAPARRRPSGYPLPVWPD